MQKDEPTTIIDMMVLIVLAAVTTIFAPTTRVLLINRKGKRSLCYSGVR